MKHTVEGKAVIPQQVWKKLNLAWSAFFLLLGSINVFFAYYLSTDAWVNFKLYGVLGAFILFGIGQSILLARYMTVEK